MSDITTMLGQAARRAAIFLLAVILLAVGFWMIAAGGQSK